MLKRLDYKLLDKLKTEDWILKNIELNALPVYDDRYIAKIGTYDDDNNINNNNNDNNNNKYYLGYFNKLVDEHDNSYHCSIIFAVELGGRTIMRLWKMKQNLPENQFEHMSSQRNELKMKENICSSNSRMVEKVIQLLYCKKMVCNPMSTTAIIFENGEWNGQSS